MASWGIALYFGVGVFLVQAFHTFNAATTYGQKQVRWLEWRWPFRRFLGREGPATDQQEERFRPLKRPYSLPWNLPNHQMPPVKTTRPYRLLGLQATNLHYCYVLSVVYGIVASLSIRFLVPEPAGISARFILLFIGVVGVLLLFSFLAVGSGLEITVLESNLAFNALILVTLNRHILEYATAVNVLQLVVALVAAPLVFWLTFQYEEGNLGYGNFMPAYYVLLSILYSEFFVLVLGLLYS